MTRNNLKWKLSGLLLSLAFALLSCAGLGTDIGQEIKQDRLEARQKMEQAEASYHHRASFGLTSEDPDHWNSTDWTLWMDSQGGGE